MNSRTRFKFVCASVFALTITVTLAMNEAYDFRAVFGQRSALILLALALFEYGVVLEVFLFAIDRFSVLKKLYWGGLYLDGLWSYTSFSEGVEYFGIWRIEQDSLGLRVIAFGLDDQFRRRSTVKSVSDMLGDGGVFEIVNARWDLSDGVRTQYSRSVLVPDVPVRHWLFSYPDVVRGETIIYGGRGDSSIAYDLRMRRRDDCQTEEELILALRNERAQREETLANEPAHQPPEAARHAQETQASR
jgi:hypothetical protein